ncbi:hypothetical protein [Terasakiella sp.]
MANHGWLPSVVRALPLSDFFFALEQTLKVNELSAKRMQGMLTNGRI